MSLSEDNLVLVSEGDLIGVVLPVVNAIPIISSNTNSPMSISRHSQNNSPMNLTQSEFSTLSNSTLHLYATLKYRDMATTSVPTSTLTPTTQSNEPFTTEAGASLSSTNSQSINLEDRKDQNGVLSGGDLAAIVLSMVLVLVAAVLITVGVIYVRRKRHRKYITTVKPGFENVLYSVSGVLKQDGAVTLDYPYYSEATIEKQESKASKNSMEEYEFIDDYYTTPMDSVYAYQQELEHVRRGRRNTAEENIYMDPGNSEDEIYSFIKKRMIKNIPWSMIIVGKQLGSGNYGTVFKGEWKVTSKDVRNVALKCLKENASRQDRLKFLQEAATMAQFRHPNVAALHGVTNKAGNIMIVVELLLQGDLHEYLLTLRPDPGELVQVSAPSLLLQFSQQISLGMNYLTKTGFIHRDLAARNILISDSLICKIADFGMSRDLHEGDYYTASGGKIPLKWTAPEALHYKKFSIASDVWSYGCVLYEIWSLGHKPFEEIGNVEVLNVLDTGGRLAPPPGCPKKIYEIMMQCWSPNTQQRPGFRDILMSLLENENVVLHIPPNVTGTHPQAATLGAPLKAGFSMYFNLQKMYMPQ